MAKLIFLGTKGEIEEETPAHRFHSSMIVETGKTRLLLDYGLLRKRSLDQVAPDAVLITHAHPDHYSWLKQDISSDIPVYCTRETLDYGKFKPDNARMVDPMRTFKIGTVECMAYRVIHSIRCPTVGWRLSLEGKVMVYNSDLVDIEEKESVLAGVDCYIGDGSAVKANLVRRRGDVLFGHTRITTQIHWCQKFGIKTIVFTHLGKETLREEALFNADHPEIIFAYDGMELEI
jgi:ribonuclease BN (tRNA processing enzyme)